MAISTYDNLIIENELMVSLGLIRHGLYYLYHEDGSEDLLVIFLQLASNGFERLLKLILTCKNKVETGKFLIKQELKNYSHNLEKAWSTISNVDNVSQQEDKFLNNLLKLFSDFGNQKRYENLNILGKSNENSISYKEQFNDCIFLKNPILDNVEYTEKDIKKENIILIEKLFVFTKNLISILENICSETKKMGYLYRKQFNDISTLLQDFNDNKISIFE